jgi:hypothetical protein
MSINKNVTYQKNNDEEAVHDVLEPGAGDGIHRPLDDGDCFEDGGGALLASLKTQETTKLWSTLELDDKN